MPFLHALKKQKDKNRGPNPWIRLTPELLAELTRFCLEFYEGDPFKTKSPGICGCIGPGKYSLCHCKMISVLKEYEYDVAIEILSLKEHPDFNLTEKS